MDHSEALQQMAAERYLLDELTPDAREAFEEHLFDCPECALDLRAGAAFVEEAKAQLPKLAGALPAPSRSSREPRVKRSGGWSGFSRPLPLPSSPPCCWSSATRIWSPILDCGRRPISRACFPGLRCTGPRGALTWPSPPTASTALRSRSIFPSSPASALTPPTPSTSTIRKGNWSGPALVAAPGDEAGDSQRLSLVIPGAMLQQRRLYRRCLRRCGSGRTHRNRPIRLRSSFNRLTRLA